ncbi:Kazal-type serine protease inhibitor family protein [Ahrensia kielensis]|uniref:Kazal-type serine protease inhibitor n=1 Tax=Ahrensia kielensis TaxID=76980 RepID=A0ABU9T4Q3_9HYPH|nr:Kazal-type serine protease inhibitor [Ahrensia kielensis]
MPILWSNLIPRAATLLGAAVILTSCTVVVEEGAERPRPPRPDRPQICTKEYSPVCARDGKEQRTFANACMARAKGFRPVSQGKCRPQQNGPSKVCTREFAPVCAQRKGSVRSFSNACTARSAGYRILRPGECR